jgi:hypothetical protein
MANAVMDEVDHRLAARAPAIRMRMLETVAYAVASGWEGLYGEYEDRKELLEVDDDVDAALDYLTPRPHDPAEYEAAARYADNAASESEVAGHTGDTAAYRALFGKAAARRPLTKDDLDCLNSALCLSIATWAERCAADMPLAQEFASRVARMTDNMSDI